MKLNNKGMTTIEILVTFIIVVIIVVSLYSSVVVLKNKETIASYKESLITYRDLLVRDIQSDLIEKGLGSVSHSSDKSANVDTIEFVFNNNEKKSLIITHQSGCEAIDEDEVSDPDLCPGGDRNIGDMYSITYGDVEYKLPNIGSAKNVSGKDIYDLKITDVFVQTNNDVFDLKIILYHPDLGTKYSIHIVSPIHFE